jgi:hypothetical protein
MARKEGLGGVMAIGLAEVQVVLVAVPTTRMVQWALA